MKNFSITDRPFLKHFNYSIVCLKGFHMRNNFKLSGSWHSIKNQLDFHRIGPLGQFGVVVKVSVWWRRSSIMSPPHVFFFKASHWPSDHMIIWRLQARWIGPMIFFSCWMDTFKGCKHSEVATSFSSLAGWTHLEAPSTVKWAHHFLLLNHSEVGPSSFSLAGWTDSTSPGN